jgi:hypothetical protein
MGPLKREERILAAVFSGSACFDFRRTDMITLWR